jgi:hypothetical protein
MMRPQRQEQITTELAKLRVGDTVKVMTTIDAFSTYEVANVKFSSTDHRVVEIGLIGRRGADRVLLPGQPWTIGTSSGGEWRGRTVKAVKVFCRAELPEPSKSGEVAAELEPELRPDPDPFTNPMLWPPGFSGRPGHVGVALIEEGAQPVWYIDLPHTIAGAWRLAAHRRAQAEKGLVERLELALGRGWHPPPSWLDREGGDLHFPMTDDPVQSVADALALAEFFARQYAEDDCAVHELHAVQQRVARLEKRVVELSGYEQVLRRIGAALGMPATASALEIGMTVSLRLLGPASPVPPVVETWSTFGEQLAAAGFGHLDPAKRGKAKQS